jgi:plastocyanin domain-containing protein
MKQGIRLHSDVQHSTTNASTHASPVADQIGPRQAGTVYDNASGIFEVLQVITDPSEARRILRRNAAQFAIEVVDLHAGTAHYTGAVWTGSDRVLKAVA